MEGADEASGCGRPSTSRGAHAPCAGSSGSLRFASAGGGGGGGGGGRGLEDEEEVSRVASCTGDDGGGGEISLREWLDRPGRGVDLLERLHIFQQVVEAVSLAHSQGVVVGNVRPSCFVMSAFHRVAFIESASCSSSGSDPCEDDGGGGSAGLAPKVMPFGLERTCEGWLLADQTGRGASREAEGAALQKKTFPLKPILLMELNWYTSPEEADGHPSTFASDVYRLGVLLFELFCTFESLDEKMGMMANLRHRVLPPQLLLKWPKEASFCLLLLHPQPVARPKMIEVLQSEFLNESRDSLEEREAAVRLKEDIEDQELLLEFLFLLQQRKLEITDKLHDTISFLSSDIHEVVHQQSILRKEGGFCSELKDNHSAVDRSDNPLEHTSVNEELSGYSSRKRIRRELQIFNQEEQIKSLVEGPSFETPVWSEMEVQVQESISSKSLRLMKNFKKLEAAYFSTRFRWAKQVGKPLSSYCPVNTNARGSEGSSVVDFTSKESRSCGRQREWMNPFLESLCKFLSFSKLKVRAELKQGDLLNSSNLVCSLGFDRDSEFFATAGVNKKIKVFECDMILNEDRDIHYPVVELHNRSKLSCICWNNYMKNQIASSDFEGVVQVWDVTRSQVFAEMREHERRVWSVDFSLADPTKLASGSDDGSVKLWNINQAGSIGTIRTKANVCSVQFQPDSAHSLAIGSADHQIYCYDLRNLRMPYCTLVGHTKTVSYVKYLDSSTIVSASTDNSLKLWELSKRRASVIDDPLQTFTGHMNTKNFVGLSLSDGYIATGSETNEVFVYHKAFPMPALSYKFTVTDPLSGQEVDDPMQFISCVCWRGQTSTLLAANSSGDIKLLELD